MIANNKSMVFENENDKIFVFILCFLSVFFNELLSYDKAGIVFVLVQLLFVFLKIFRGKFEDAFLAHMLFVLSAMEWGADLFSTNSIYSYRTVNFFEISISTAVLFLFLFINFLKKRKPCILGSKKFLFAIILTFVAMLHALVGLYADSYRLTSIVGDFNYFLVILIVAYLCSLYRSREFINRLESILVFILMSRIVIDALAFSLGLMKGAYGSISIFSYDPLKLFIPFIIFSCNYSKPFIYNISVVIVWLVGLISSFFLIPSGKSIILVIVSLLVIVYKLLKQKKSKVFSYFLVIFVLIGILLSAPLYSKNLVNNLMFSIKLNQAKSLVMLEWINDPYLLPASPRARVLEFVNTAAYFVDHPLFIIWGRGFGGYFQDDYIFDDSASPKGGYSEYEVKTRKFSHSHSSLNIMFLKFGLIGLVAFGWALLQFVSKKNKDIKGLNIFWRMTGFFSFLLVLGFSVKLAYLIGFFLSILCVSKNDAFSAGTIKPNLLSKP